MYERQNKEDNGLGHATWQQASATRGTLNAVLGRCVEVSDREFRGAALDQYKMERPVIHRLACALYRS